MLDLAQSGVDSSAFQLRNGSLGLEIRFSPEAHASITQEIGVGFVSIPRRGAEVGGILAGQMQQRHSEWLVTIDHIVPVPIEYQYGPSWRLSDGDSQRFQELVREGADSAGLIGWYRSNTRPEHEPQQADRQISRTFFGAGPSIFLFCEPFPDGRIRATCIIMPPRGAEVAFSFDLGRFLHCRAPVSSPVVPDPQRQPAERPPAPASGAKTRRYVLPFRYARIAAGALLLVGFTWYARSRPGGAPDRAGGVVAAASPSRAIPDATLLGLRADYQANSLLIGWDRNSPAITSAASAIFTITEGARTRTLHLATRELQHGSILYKPGADEIKVELSVTSPAGRTASQSIRILGAAPAPRAAEIRTAPVARSAPAELAPATPIEAPTAAFEEPVARVPARPRDIAAPNIDIAAPKLDVGAPELVAGSLPVNVTLPAPPVSAAGSRELHPATPLHAPQPSLPPSVNLPDYAFDRPFQVQVEVSINASGRVTGAHLVGSAGPYASLLGSWALNTARLWTFHPATLGGEPIPSTMVLTFHYARQR